MTIAISALVGEAGERSGRLVVFIPIGYGATTSGCRDVCAFIAEFASLTQWVDMRI